MATVADIAYVQINQVELPYLVPDAVAVNGFSSVRNFTFTLPAGTQPHGAMAKEISRAARVLHGLLLLIAISPLTTCTDLKKNLSKAVVIEYEQSLNFFQYEFQNLVHDPATNGGYTGVSLPPKLTKITGVWILYQLCSIQNVAPKAAVFDFKTSNLYVEYGNNGQSFAGQPLQVPNYNEVGYSDFASPYSALVPAQFKQETQTSPDTQTIPAGYSDYSMSWRFVIFMPGPTLSDPASESDVQAKLIASLHYSGYPVVLKNRGYLPVPLSPLDKKIHSGDLPSVCRPKQG